MIFWISEYTYSILSLKLLLEHDACIQGNIDLHVYNVVCMSDVLYGGSVHMHARKKTTTHSRINVCDLLELYIKESI